MVIVNMSYKKNQCTMNFISLLCSMNFISLLCSMNFISLICSMNFISLLCTMNFISLLVLSVVDGKYHPVGIISFVHWNLKPAAYTYYGLDTHKTLTNCT